jgi:hypothetical protein
VLLDVDVPEPPTIRIRAGPGADTFVADQLRPSPKRLKRQVLGISLPLAVPPTADRLGTRSPAEWKSGAVSGAA